MTGGIDDFPADLSSDLWRQVESLVDDPSPLTADERKSASAVLLRLGYVRRAAEIVGMKHRDLSNFRFSREYASEELQVLRRTRHDARELEEVALEAATDQRLSADTRMRMATFIVVRNGARGADSLALHGAAGLAKLAMKSLANPPFARYLAQQTVYRAIAFVPFVKGDFRDALATLDLALNCQVAACPSSASEELAWKDHAFPLYQTIARTHLLRGNARDAASATERLIELSPNDERAWDIRGQALIALSELDGALLAYERMRELGGLAAAKAAFHMGWIHQQRGSREEATEFYEQSIRIDPTVPVVHAAIGGV